MGRLYTRLYIGVAILLGGALLVDLQFRRIPQARIPTARIPTET